MYIQCKKDFNKVLFDFKKDDKCPITNIVDDCIYFISSNGKPDNISKHYLEVNKEYLEIKKEKLCKHDNIIKVFNLILCSECDELISIQDKKVSIVEFLNKI